MSDIADRVKNIVVEHLGVDADKVVDGASFIDDLGADSLDTVELVMAFEEEFAVEIPDDAAGNTTLVLVSHLVAPNAKLASLRSLETELMASSDIVRIMGKTITETTNIALAALKYVASNVSCINGLIVINAKYP